jgi:hypothetical protein
MNIHQAILDMIEHDLLMGKPHNPHFVTFKVKKDYDVVEGEVLSVTDEIEGLKQIEQK